jgi:hypothetical protein
MLFSADQNDTNSQPWQAQLRGCLQEWHRLLQALSSKINDAEGRKRQKGARIY